jgi:hypothetical protein
LARTAICALVTNCSARKSALGAPGLLYRNLAKGPQSAVGDRWLAALEQAPATTRARDLYSGRGVVRMQALADRLGAPLYIASAGLGLVKSEEKVPSYDLSVSTDTPSAVQRLIDDDFCAKAWWSNLSRSPYATPINDLFDENADHLICIAVSNSYVPLMSDDLARLDKKRRDRLRLFGAADSKYQPALRPMLMPYDRRLDTLVRGSKVDFAQRAAEHFIVALTTDKHFPTSVDEQRAWVAATLDEVPIKAQEKRQVVDDAKIMELAGGLAAQGHSHTRALGILRKQGIACEQGRFRRLFIEATK